ncbi:MAG: hypothetical protein AXA67_06195 [Methylothermaceae bacteria B42]|nr:MAG: hypothetical protein AXA67_06195 [Methylothermaceae bacteria B42]
MSWGKRFGVLGALAFALALGIAVMLWANAPEYKPLFLDLSENQAGQVLDALDKLKADYKVDTRRGSILVPAEEVHELRLRLAAQGLPKKEENGYEILDKDAGFGTSRTMEKARFQRALEGEIARSVMTLEGVKAARVHLAQPKQSVFVRQRKPPSASVLVQLMPGYELTPGQVKAIVHLVASSVPRLEPERVTVVDQLGHLLNSPDKESEDQSLTEKQFEYKKRVEDSLVQRIESLLGPVTGPDSLRAQVSADIDFTAVERTEELYNPDLPALRSEQQEERKESLERAQGVPGALTNQPPAAGKAPETATGGGNEENGSPTQTQKKLVRNYELDRTLSHIRQSVGDIRRLTVAVAVDNIEVVQEDGSVVSRPYTPEELNDLTALVKQAVGYDATRGDQVTVTNMAFRGVQEISIPPLPIWQQAWVWRIGKQVAALLVVLLLIFFILRPLVRSLMPPKPPELEAEEEQDSEEGEEIEGEAAVGEDGEPLSLEQQSEELLMLEGPQSYEKRLAFVRQMIEEEPDRVVQVIKNWIAEEPANG